MSDPVQTSARDDRVRRLRLAQIAGGRVPADLWPWVFACVGADAQTTAADSMTPAERLQVALSDEIDAWMRARGLTQRDLGGSIRRSLTRCLRGDNVTIETLAEVAAALGCDVAIEFRDISVAKPDISVANPLQPRRSGRTVGRG
jgi:hypothetical protein